jgi:guanosine-3',5'-bis(diphosphate) 3'-pyrophosphohydrolase
MTSTIEKAMEFAKEKHAGKLDDEDKDYFTAHLCQVADIIKLIAPNDTELIQAAYLHDTLEDTETTCMELRLLFGQRVSRIVLEVTHEGCADNDGYYFPRLKSKDAIMLKFADRLSNLSRMNGWPKARQDQYVKKSKFWRGRIE